MWYLSIHGKLFLGNFPKPSHVRSLCGEWKFWSGLIHWWSVNFHTHCIACSRLPRYVLRSLCIIANCFSGNSYGMQVSLLLMLPLDEGLAQCFYILWDVLEQSPLFWTAVISWLTTTMTTTTTTNTTVHIIMMLELSAPHVSYVKYKDSHFRYYSWTGVSYYGHSDNAGVPAYYTIILTAELYILSCLWLRSVSDVVNMHE